MTGFRVLDKYVFGIKVNTSCAELVLAYPIAHLGSRFVLMVNVTIDDQESFILMTGNK